MYEIDIVEISNNEIRGYVDKYQLSTFQLAALNLLGDEVDFVEVRGSFDVSLDLDNHVELELGGVELVSESGRRLSLELDAIHVGQIEEHILNHVRYMDLIADRDAAYADYLYDRYKEEGA